MSYKKKTESIVKDIKRRTRRKFSSEEKIHIVLEGLKGESSNLSQHNLVESQLEVNPIIYFMIIKTRRIVFDLILIYKP